MTTKKAPTKQQYTFRPRAEVRDKLHSALEKKMKELNSPSINNTIETVLIRALGVK